jgi:hypothetical protein
MFTEVIYYPLFGKSLLFYIGVIALLLLIVTAGVAVLATKGEKKFTLQGHATLAKAAMALAIIHGGMAILAYL